MASDLQEFKLEKTADCYSAGERAAMERYQQVRAKWLAPLLSWMTRAGLTPDSVTLLSLIAGLAFCPLFFWSPLVAFSALGSHLILDALDGPLARFQNTASKAGSFTDTFCDQIIVCCSTAVLMPLPISIVPGVAYIFVYTLVVVFAMVRNALGIPYSWLFRPRIIVYLALAIETILLQKTRFAGSINSILWLVNGLLLLKLASGFWQLRKRLKRGH